MVSHCFAAVESLKIDKDRATDSGTFPVRSLKSTAGDGCRDAVCTGEDFHLKAVCRELLSLQGFLLLLSLEKAF